MSPLEDSIDKYGKLENDPDIENESIEFYRKIGLISDKNEVLTYSEYENYYENNEENIKKYIEIVKSDDQIVTETALFWNYRKKTKEKMSLEEARKAYINSVYGYYPESLRESIENSLTDKNVIDYFCSNYDWEYNESNKESIQIKGIGGDCYIRTDHNAFSCLVLKTSDIGLAKAEENLALKGALNPLQNDRIYKFGAALIIGLGEPIATQSQILLKFHSNLDQLGGNGDIDEQYNLLGKVGSEEYVWEVRGRKRNNIACNLFSRINCIICST